MVILGVTLNLADSQVQSALIQSVGAVLAAGIASTVAAFIGHQITGRKKLQASLVEAVGDIHFLLAVETEHCNKHQEVHDETFKRRIRQLARDQGFSWSGKFTPGRSRNVVEGS